MRKLENKSIYYLKATLSDWDGRVKGKPSRTIAIEGQNSLYDLALAINNAFDFDFDHAFGFFDNLDDPYDSEESYELFSDLEDDDDEDELPPTPEMLEELSKTIPGGENNPAFIVTKAAMGLDQEVLKQRYLGATRSILREELLKNISSDQHPKVQDALDMFVQNMLPDDLDEDDDLGDIFGDDGQDSGSVKNTAIGNVFDQVGKKMLFLFDYGDEWRFVVELKKLDVPAPKTRYPKVVESVGKAPEQYGDEDE